MIENKDKSSNAPIIFDFSTKPRHYTNREIKAIRRALNETQEEFSKRFFVSRAAVNRWEMGMNGMQGPALRIMQVCEQLAFNAIEKRNEGLKMFRKRKLKEVVTCGECKYGVPLIDKIKCVAGPANLRTPDSSCGKGKKP